NQPRFTLEELRQVLWERNDLKTKLMEVEEELRLFKEQEEDEDGNAAVEGPIPLEPDEKLYGYKRDESKVRQLLSSVSLQPAIDILRSLFSSSKTSSSPEERSTVDSLTNPSTPVSTNHSVTQSQPTFSTPSTQTNGSGSKRLSMESLFGSQRKTAKPPISLLSPPPSE
ncbi:unnamed protein product, partial [Adineta ricciae]